MKKTAIVLFGLASSAATASASAPRLAAHDAAPSRSVEPGDDFDAWLAKNYGPAKSGAVDRHTLAANQRHRGERFMTTATELIVDAKNAFAPAVRLLAAPMKETLPVAYPLADERGDIACGNVATKGGDKHVCYDRTTGEQISRVWLDD